MHIYILIGIKLYILVQYDNFIKLSNSIKESFSEITELRT